MRTHLAVTTIAAASLLLVAACDTRDYEAEIATLEGDLQTARSENEQMQAELDELRTQAEAQPGMDEGALENVQSQLNNVLQTAAQTFERAGQAASGDQSAEALRADMQLIVQSTQAAAQDLGVELETVAMDTDGGPAEGTGTPEPAAGPDTQAPQEQGATEEQPAATEEQPAAGQEQQEQQPAAQ